MKTYTVTVTPKYAMRIGSWQAGPYEVEICAKDRAAAIKAARRDYEDGKTNPATYTAKQKKGS
jgi:hypothetical protein